MWYIFWKGIIVKNKYYDIFFMEEFCTGKEGIIMIDKRYIISDAAKIVEVESHVLRYWEEELDIKIPRNEMGHRYYTDFYIDLFKRIKELKEGGFQLKAIKIMVPELMKMEKEGNVDIETLKDELFGKITESELNEELTETDMHEETEHNNEIENTSLSELDSSATVEKNTEKNYKLEQFQSIITEVVSNALKENTGFLGKEVGDIVSDNVIKEMDYLMHIREKQEEERFKKLDETIRSYQMSGRERSKEKKGIFSKIKKL